MTMLTFSKYLQGQYIYPHKADGSPFTDEELTLVVMMLNDLQLPEPKTTIEESTCEDI